MPGKAYYITFPDYNAKVDKTPEFVSNLIGEDLSFPTGHAGILMMDENGNTRYYEFGRYNPNGQGLIGEKLPADVGNYRKVTVPDYNGKNMKDIMNRLKKAAHQDRLWAHEIPNFDYDAALDYVDQRAKASEDERRKDYDYKLLLENCATFGQDVIEAGGVDDINWPVLIRSPRRTSAKLERQGYPYVEYKFGGSLPPLPKRK